MIALVLAMDVHGLIGQNNDLPWHYPEDLKYFKELTLNKNVLMGRKTYDSIFNRLGKALPNRQNYVASRQNKPIKDVQLVNDIHSFIKEFKDDLYIIGGKEIFEQSKEYADYIYITYIKHLYEGDTFINFDYSQYNMKIIKETSDLIFTVYERN